MKKIDQTQIDRAIDRLMVLVDEPSLNQPPENVIVNAPVALQQIAWQHELNGILLGLGFATLRVGKLPISKEQKKEIKRVLKLS